MFLLVRCVMAQFRISEKQSEIWSLWLQDTKLEFSNDNLAIAGGEDGLCCRIKQLIGLLRELVLTDRWQHVPEILACILSNEKPGSVHMGSVQSSVQSICLENLLQTAAGKTGRFASIVKKLAALQKMDSHPALMTFFLHQISCGRSEEAKEVPDLPRIHHTCLGLQQDLKHVMKAYRGLLTYVEWSQLRDKIKSLEQDEEYLQHAGSADELLMQRHLLDSLATHALVRLQAVQGHRQVWDIFVSKEAEILEYFGKVDEAERVLGEYAKEHPSNFCALMLLYEFYKRNGRSSKLRIQVLEEIVTLAPFEAVALELYELYKGEGKKHSTRGKDGSRSTRKTSGKGVTSATERQVRDGYTRKDTCKRTRGEEGMDVQQEHVSDCLVQTQQQTVTSQQEAMTSAREGTAWQYKACRVLFTLLDYPQWKDNAELWRLLASELEAVKSGCECRGDVRELWEDRRSWWPDYCFVGLRKNSPETSCWKCICAALLLGRENEQSLDVLAACLEHPQLTSPKELKARIRGLSLSPL